MNSTHTVYYEDDYFAYLLVLLVITLLVASIYNAKIEELLLHINTMETKHNIDSQISEAKLDILQEEYDVLQEDFDALKQQYDTLTEQYDSIKDLLQVGLSPVGLSSSLSPVSLSPVGLSPVSLSPVKYICKKCRIIKNVEI